MKFSPLFKKYLTSYITLVILPIIVLGSAVIVFFYQTYFAENMSIFSKVLAQQVTAFDENIINLNKATSSISNNSYLSEGYLHSSISNQMISAQYMNNYGVSNDFISQIHLVYFNDNRVFNSQGVLTEQYFLSKYQSDQLTKSYLQNTLTRLKKPYIKRLDKIRDLYQNTRYAYVAPLPDYGATPYGATVFLISNSNITSYLNNISSTVKCPSFMLDEDGDVFAVSEGGYPASKDLIHAATHAKSKNLHINGQDYFVITQNSRLTGLTFYAVTMPQTLNPNFMLLVKIIAVSSIVILIGSSFLIYYLMTVNYKPLHILESQAMSNDADPQKLKSLQSIVTNITAKIESLENYHTATIDERCNNLLISLLTGNISSIKDFQEDCEKYNFKLEGSYFAAASLLFSDLSQADNEKLCQRVSDFLEVKCYPVDVMKKNHLTFILSSETNSYPMLLSAAQSLHAGIKQSIGCILTIGVGTWVKNPEEISTSYLNSLTSLEARLVKGLDTIIMFQELEQQTTTSFQYPYLLVEQFKNALHSNNTELIISSIDNIFKKIKTSDMAIVTTRTFCYNIVQITVRSLSKNTARPDLAQESLLTINRLMQSETVDTLAQSLKDICVEFIQNTEYDSTPSSKHLDRMIDYIQENYCDPDFSLQKMADHFKMSSSYVSRYFASQNDGVTMLEYTNQLRMEKAKKLLAQTDATIPDIAKMVAYLNLSSFTRKFKQMVGVPPGTYRKQCCQKTDSNN